MGDKDGDYNDGDGGVVLTVQAAVIMMTGILINALTSAATSVF